MLCFKTNKKLETLKITIIHVRIAETKLVVLNVRLLRKSYEQRSITNISLSLRTGIDTEWCHI